MPDDDIGGPHDDHFAKAVVGALMACDGDRFSKLPAHNPLEVSEPRVL